MRGRKSDALGSEVQQASLTQWPQNHFVRFGYSLNPMLQTPMGINPKADLISQRSLKARVFNRAQGENVTLQGESRKEGLGQVILPKYPGIWGSGQNG